MARGKWLSEDEKAGILKMHAAGMSAAEIASLMQRGVKSIQRVLFPKSERADGSTEPLSPGSEANAMPLEAPIPAQTDPMARLDTAKQGHAQSGATPVHELRKVPVKAPKRPKKPTSKTASIPPTPGTGNQMPTLTLVKDIQVQQSHLHLQPQLSRMPMTLSAHRSNPVNQFSSTPSHPLQGGLPPSSYLSIRQYSTDIPRDTVHDLRGIADAPPTPQAESYLDETTVVDIVPNHDSDDECCRTTKCHEHNVHQRLRGAEESRRLSGVGTGKLRDTERGQTVMSGVPSITSTTSLPSTASVLDASPLSLFQDELQLTRLSSSQTTPTSQVEPEPPVARKRKRDFLGVREPTKMCIQRTLKMVDEAIVECTKSHDLGIYEERLILMLQRFQAEIRLLQLEKICHQTKVAEESFSFSS